MEPDLTAAASIGVGSQRRHVAAPLRRVDADRRRVGHESATARGDPGKYVARAIRTEGLRTRMPKRIAAPRNVATALRRLKAEKPVPEGLVEQLWFRLPADG